MPATKVKTGGSKKLTSFPKPPKKKKTKIRSGTVKAY
jgi:hypothetical protein